MVDSIRILPALLAWLAVLGLVPGCGNSEDGFTASVAGSYTVAVTNRESTCQMGDWVEGNMATSIPFEVTQTGGELEGNIGGAAGLYLMLVQGSSDFEGSVDGNHFRLTNYGTRSVQQGNCSFTYNAVIEGTLVGDAISGTITYSPATNDNPDCDDVECSAVQEFSGSRPPP